MLKLEALRKVNANDQLASSSALQVSPLQENVIMKLRILCVLVILLSSCTYINEKSVYEGVRSIQKASSAGGTDIAPSKPLPSYEQYEQDRTILKNDSR